MTSDAIPFRTFTPGQNETMHVGSVLFSDGALSPPLHVAAAMDGERAKHQSRIESPGLIYSHPVLVSRFAPYLCRKKVCRVQKSAVPN